MYRSGLVDTLVTHANTKGFGLTSLSGVRRGFMPPQLKTKQKHFEKDKFGNIEAIRLINKVLDVFDAYRNNNSSCPDSNFARMTQH